MFFCCAACCIRLTHFAIFSLTARYYYYLANGNLQRLFSSYYDAPVHVVVDKCVQRTDTTWDRVVHLTVFGEKFCTAMSHITVHNADCRMLVESGTVGLGQLFRHLDKLPSFSLLDAGYCEQGGLWRMYELKCAQLSCRIEEKFLPGMWNVQPKENIDIREEKWSETSRDSTIGR